MSASETSLCISHGEKLERMAPASKPQPVPPSTAIVQAARSYGSWLGVGVGVRVRVRVGVRVRVRVRG